MKTINEIENRIEYLRDRKRLLKGDRTWTQLQDHKRDRDHYNDLEDQIQTLIWCLGGGV